MYSVWYCQVRTSQYTQTCKKFCLTTPTLILMLLTLQNFFIPRAWCGTRMLEFYRSDGVPYIVAIYSSMCMIKWIGTGLRQCLKDRRTYLRRSSNRFKVSDILTGFHLSSCIRWIRPRSGASYNFHLYCTRFNTSGSVTSRIPPEYANFTAEMRFFLQFWRHLNYINRKSI